MQIRMVGHASVILYTAAGGLWCDPWLSGKAFNNAWTLRPAPSFEPALYAGIDYLWILHEHPDHFNVPTLKSLDEAFKARVKVLFQKKNSEKLFDAMRAWGFRNFIALPDRNDVALPGGVKLYCQQVGLIDSVLAVTDRGGETVLNLNDADLPEADARRLRRHIGAPTVVLNQFSIAGNDGHLHPEEALRISARRRLDAMLADHRLLGAQYTLPFASFVYFSAIDNRFMNQHANAIGKVQAEFDAAGFKTLVLQPGDECDTRQPWDNAPALAALQHSHDTVGEAPYDTPPLIALAELETAFKKFQAALMSYYPGFLVRRIGTLRFHLQDHGRSIECDFAQGILRDLGTGNLDADIELYSQPLHFGFAVPFGFETLGVSGRFRVLQNRPRWRSLKVLSILFNQQVYLRPPHLFDTRTLAYLSARLRSNLLRQFLYKRKLRQGLG